MAAGVDGQVLVPVFQGGEPVLFTVARVEGLAELAAVVAGLAGSSVHSDGESGDLLGLDDAVVFDCPESGFLLRVVVVDMDENLQGAPVCRFRKKWSGDEFSENWVGSESRFSSKSGDGASLLILDKVSGQRLFLKTGSWVGVPVFEKVACR